MLRKIPSLLVLLGFLVSCASGTKEEKGLFILTNEDEPKEVPFHIEAAHDAKKTKDDPNHIVGAAQIESPEKYERKTYYLYGADHLNLENLYFDVPVVYNQAVKKWINYFSKRGRRHFQRYSARGGRYGPVLSKILNDQGMPRDLIFLSMAESGFQNKAKSWAKAVGAWQFMPFTGKSYGLRIDWYVDERRDPIKATIAASKYLSKLYQMFGSWELAWAGYNAGEGKIRRAIRRYKTENFWKLRRYRYIRRETKEYVPKIMALAIIGKNLKTFGFDDINFHEPLDFEEIEVAANQDLYLIAEALKISFEDLKTLNPELRRWQTPLNVEKYILRVPVGSKTVWNSCCGDKAYDAVAYKKYSVKGRKAYLKDVARKFKLKYNILSDINRKPANASLKRGEEVLLPFRTNHSNKHDMYADLYDKPRRSVVKKRKYRSRIRTARKRGKVIKNPSTYHTVRKGESLWKIARSYGQSLDTIIASNLNILNRRQIRAGDKLVVK